MLTEIASFCNLNLGGLALVEYAPVPWVNEVDFPDYINSAGNIDQDIPFNEGDWLRCPFLITSMTWEEPFVSNAQNGYYKPRLTGITPQLRAEVNLELGQMKNYRFILRLKDRNARQWIIGNPFYPLSFGHTLASGNQSGLAAYTLTWEGEQLTPSPGFLLPA